MIVTIWWEDARQAVRSKAYGPDQLVAACVADDLACTIKAVTNRFTGVPKKGVGNVMRCLREEAANFSPGPLCAVIDHDKVLDLWPSDRRPTPCKQGICSKIRADAPGDYRLVLLYDNVESLVDASCLALGWSKVPDKRPTERDKVLQALAFSATPAQRQVVRGTVDGFDRLVTWVADKLS